MPKLRVACLLLAVPLFAQIDSNSITVTASRNLNIPPDQAVFAIYVDTPLTTALADVIAVLQSASITAANLEGVRTASNLSFNAQTQPPQLEWSFRLVVPLSKAKDAIAGLSAIRDKTSVPNGPYTMYFVLQGTQTSPAQSGTAQCSITDLVSDARAQAQKIANAGGVVLGNVLGISGTTQAIVPLDAQSNSLAGLTGSPLNCSLTVKFGLTRF